MAEKNQLDGTKYEKMYCVKCRNFVIVLDPSHVKLKSNRPALMGKCPDCKTRTFKIVSSGE
jgi:RNase P subunit RPR2